MRFGPPSIVPAGDNSDLYLGTGLATWTGDSATALYDGSDDTYASTYYDYHDGDSFAHLDGIAIPLLDDLHVGDVIPIRMMTPNVQDGSNGWFAYLNLTPNAQSGPLMVGYAESYDGNLAIFDTTITVLLDVAAGQTIYWLPYGKDIATPGPAEVRTIQFGPLAPTVDLDNLRTRFYKRPRSY